MMAAITKVTRNEVLSLGLLVPAFQLARAINSVIPEVCAFLVHMWGRVLGWFVARYSFLWS